MKAAESVYDLKSADLPYLAGAKLRWVIGVLDGPLRHLLMPRLLREAGVSWLRTQFFDEAPTYAPVHPICAPQPNATQTPTVDGPHSTGAATDHSYIPKVQDYARAYREKSTSPEDVAEQVLRAIAESNEANPPLHAVIAWNRVDVLRQAAAAGKRIRSGGALSIFDGVPVGVKDEVDMVPFPTTAGTAFLGRHPAKVDSTVVARFRAAGALLIGKTNMHEIGIGVTGLNPHHGTPRNPHAMDRHTGGSSSGSAAAVAAGLCPVAVAADGGGSIRIPAALCGVVGLKPTYGRVSEFGAVPLCWSVAHIGPIGASAADTALAYGVMAGPDPKDPVSVNQPPPDSTGCDGSDLHGVTFGVYWPWFRHADEEVVTICEAMLARFRDQGAQIREVIIPDLEAARVAHAVTICSEMAQAMAATYARHGREHGSDVRVALRIARALTALDYIHAQRVRARLLGHFRRALSEVDAILTPTTATVAPRIPEAELNSGVSDLSMATALMRFCTPANFTGLPAISFPAGLSSGGLPVGMQAIGRAWDEALLLRIAAVAESCIGRKVPGRFFNVLPKS
jgi:Asp-tRNA(Asn)/Glu-tRNA(Gln) amidotransferase A subunit family amidase